MIILLAVDIAVSSEARQIAIQQGTAFVTPEARTVPRSIHGHKVVSIHNVTATSRTLVGQSVQVTTRLTRVTS